jgi:hypothetical protein
VRKPPTLSPTTPQAPTPRESAGNSGRMRLLQSTADQGLTGAHKPLEGQNPAQHLRTPEAAAFLGASASFLNHKRLTGDRPPYRKLAAKVVVYDIDELREWARNTSRASTSGSPSG